MPVGDKGRTEQASGVLAIEWLKDSIGKTYSLPNNTSKTLVDALGQAINEFARCVTINNFSDKVLHIKPDGGAGSATDFAIGAGQAYVAWGGPEILNDFRIFSEDDIDIGVMESVEI